MSLSNHCHTFLFPPFGVVLKGRNWSTEEYRYGFQSQEQDEELWEGAVTFKYRVEDARLGRFFSVDPLYSKYPYWSTFSFSGNLVTHCFELEGLEAVVGISLGGDVEYRKQHLSMLSEQAIVKSIYEPVLPTDPSEIEMLTDILKTASKEDPSGTIGLITIWGHGNGLMIWGSNREGVENQVGFITFDDLDALREEIASGDIAFAEGAVIFISACNAGTDFDQPNNEMEYNLNTAFTGPFVVDDTELKSFAQELADITGVSVIAGRDEDTADGIYAGGVGPKNEKKGEEMEYEVRDYKRASFYEFKRGELPKEIGDRVKTSSYTKADTAKTNSKESKCLMK